MIEKKVDNRNIPSFIEEKILEIKNDSIHGSTILLNKTIKLFQNIISSEESISIELFQTIAINLIQAQPTMASLVSFSNELLNYINGFPLTSSNQIKFKNSLSSFLKVFEESLGKSEKAIQKHAVCHLGSYSIIATYSSSGTIQKVIESLAKNQSNLKVYCSESRPKNEGTLLAKSLAKKGIQTIFMTDVTLFSKINEVDIIIIGADAITESGIINKMGSYPLARLANENSVPLYCLCSSHKMLPAEYSLPKEPVKPSTDIIPDKNLNLDVINYYFDNTPLELFTGIITENGLFKPMKIRRALRNKHLNSLLRI